MTYQEIWKLGFASLVAVLAIFAFTNPAHAVYEKLSRTEVKIMVVREAQNSSVPPALALAVAKVESDFNPTALSTAGARGVMQIMPKTAKDEFGVDEDELWKVRLNIQLGIDYLAKLRRQYGGNWELALSHYNGGTLKGKGADAEPHAYTKNYVRMVKRWQQRYTDQNQVWMVASNKAFTDRRYFDDGWKPLNRGVASRYWRFAPDYRDSFRSNSSARTSLKYNQGDRDRLNRPYQNDHYWVDRGYSNLESRRQWAAQTLDDFSSGLFRRFNLRY